MEPTGFINPPMARVCCRIGSALFNQRPGTEARISVLPPRLPFAAVIPPGTGKFGVGLFLTEFMSPPKESKSWAQITQTWMQ
jgi:hypothetical protein